jgi:hypothetical protein|tara:strand:+ start:255 stop:395 length:141 start_codon:yes stop_codon:yes gene_type:complete
MFFLMKFFANLKYGPEAVKDFEEKKKVPRVSNPPSKPRRKSKRRSK